MYGPIKQFHWHIHLVDLPPASHLKNCRTMRIPKLVLIAPATETTTAIESAFKIIGINNERLKKSLEQIIFEISGREAAWFSIRRAMRNISASVLWMHDEEDDMTPLADALKVKEDHHPNIQFHITKGLGHRKIYRDAEVKKHCSRLFVDSLH